ncbi:RagB/SusD family nutrient uptake outer membrane protein [Echinicola salinicaeni]|uniref:RagB/SusD family nutrient uptake outer membrane protein n=1 Tax=Echinicola salinicaeni TaxID=2762757 RepID=UPI001644E6FA|nr:RagB/SusD family nutrient uptake outer membrane protein [Echinicola salinicaeni]
MKKYIIAMSAMLALGSCNEEFLDKYPQTSVAPDAFFKSGEDLELYVNGLLSLESPWSAYLGDQSSDNMATTAAVEIKSMMTGSPSSQTITGGWSWGRLRDINYFLDNYEQAEAAEETKAHFAGLARYYRAQFYFGKIGRYSDVPWYEVTLNPSDAELYKARDPREMVMEMVMEDLAYAAANVRESVPSGTPDVWAVKAFYARVALYEGTYRKYHAELGLESTANEFLEKARDISKEIMDSGNFSIYTTGNPEADYLRLFDSQVLFGNPEVILVNAYDNAKSRGGFDGGTVFGDYEQSPSRDLVMSYLMADGSRFTDIPGHESMGYVEEFQNRDPRLTQTLVYPGWVRRAESSPYIQNLSKNFTGYHQLKGYANTIDFDDQRGMDFPVYRYAEILLTYAEAKAELNELTQGDLDVSVNLLRERVNLPGLDMAEANANPDSFLASKYPNLTGANQGVILEIRRERRIEFAMEGFRYDDLMRWHAGKLLENIPEGMYFDGLGKYDMTGDGVEDIILVSKDTDIPTGDAKEKNSLGETLIYYKAGFIGESVDVYLKDGENGGNMETETKERSFVEPKYYYRPIPIQQVTLNPNLEQIFGWE